MLVDPGGRLRSETGRMASKTVDGVRRCRVCRKDKPADLEHYGVRRWEDKAAKRVRYWKAECRVCLVDAERRRSARLRDDPGRKEQLRVADLAYKARQREAARKARAVADSSYAYGPEPEEPRLRVAVESFRPHWDRLVLAGKARFLVQEDMDGTSHNARRRSLNGAFDTQAFARWLGIEHDEYVRVQEYMKPSRVGQTATVDFWQCERVLTGAGLPHVVNQLYVVKRS